MPLHTHKSYETTNHTTNITRSSPCMPQSPLWTTPHHYNTLQATHSSLYLQLTYPFLRHTPSTARTGVGMHTNISLPPSLSCEGAANVHGMGERVTLQTDS